MAVHHDNLAALQWASTLLDKIRAERPRVHCLTNPVAQNISANCLLAIGAAPSMTADAEVIDDFVGGTQALVVNLGMLDEARKASIPKAVATANKLGRPWLLDPVKVDRAGARLAFATNLLGQGPAILRCNLDESDRLRNEIKGFSGVVAVTGACDRISQGGKQFTIANGSPVMDRVTAMGCAASAMLGAFLAVASDPWQAAAAGLLVFAVAGEIADAQSGGPGSFQPALLDTLFTLDADRLAERAKIQ